MQAKVERILPNHSVPMADGQALTQMGDAFAAIKAGMPPVGIEDGIEFYPFEKFSVILRHE